MDDEQGVWRAHEPGTAGSGGEERYPCLGIEGQRRVEGELAARRIGGGRRQRTREIGRTERLHEGARDRAATDLERSLVGEWRCHDHRRRCGLETQHASRAHVSGDQVAVGREDDSNRVTQCYRQRAEFSAPAPLQNRPARLGAPLVRGTADEEIPHSIDGDAMGAQRAAAEKRLHGSRFSLRVHRHESEGRLLPASFRRQMPHGHIDV